MFALVKLNRNGGRWVGGRVEGCDGGVVVHNMHTCAQSIVCNCLLTCTKSSSKSIVYDIDSHLFSRPNQMEKIAKNKIIRIKEENTAVLHYYHPYLWQRVVDNNPKHGKKVESHRLLHTSWKDHFASDDVDLTKYNKIAIQGTHQMAVDKEAISLSRVYS